MSEESQQQDDILREHTYDGIQEYDNKLPLWWQATFYITIVAAVLYVGYYHFGPGRLGAEDLAYKQKLALEAMMANSEELPSEDILRKMLTDGSRIDKGKTLFESKERQCTVCHNADLLGNTGPNLRDDKWKHGSNLTDIFNTIWNGVPQAGMPSQRLANVPQDDVINLALYIVHMNKTQKEPNGRMNAEDEKDDPITY